MPIYDNSYTNSYIRITGCIVTYNLSKANENSDEKEDEIYNVRDCYTNKKYIYWNAKAPNELEFSNKILEKGLGAGRYLIVINDNGTHTEYINNNNPEFTVSFDGDSMNIVEKKVWGLYEKTDEHTEKFANIVSDIDGIRQDVGRVETTSNSIKETVSKFDQKADAIISSVGSKTKELVNSELRNNVYAKIIALATEIGTLSSSMDVFLSDLKLGDDEKTKIRNSIENIKSKKIDVDSGVNEIKVKCKEGNIKNKLITAQSDLNARHNNLIDFINRLLDLIGNIGSDDITTMYTLFQYYSAAINEIKNASDDAMMEILGGSVAEEMSQIKQTAQEIRLEVSSKVDANGVEDIARSTITQSANEVKIAFNKINSASVSFTSEGLEVNNGRIKTDALIPGTSRRIVMEPGKSPGDNTCMSIDTNYEGIRLKKDDVNYVKVSDGVIDFFLSGHSYGIRPYNSSTCNFNNMLVQRASGIAIKAVDGYSETYLRIYNNGGMSSFVNGSSYNHASISNINSKENILYIKSNDINTKFNKLRSNLLLNENEKNFSNIDILLDDLHDFIKRDLKLCQYNFNNEYYGGDIDKVKNKLKFGFIAQDVMNTKIGKLIFNSGNFQYEESNYISVIAGALQMEIKKREGLENEVDKLYEIINELKGE